MNESLFTIGLLICIVSSIALFIGIILLFFENKRQNAVKILIYSFIGLIIGFSTCIGVIG